MRGLLQFLVCLSLVIVVPTARATKINILGQSVLGVNSVDTSPFVIGGATPFTACSAGELPNPMLIESGCFSAVNQTGSNLSALELVIPNFGTSFSCNTDDAAQQIFSAYSCNFDALSNSYDLRFYDGTLTAGEHFTITEDDVPPGAFPDVLVIATLVPTSSTPEPSSLLLLVSGLMGVGLLRVPSRKNRCTE